MPDLKINLLKIKELISQRPRQRLRRTLKIIFYSLAVFIIFVASFSVQIIFSGESNLKKWNLWGQIKHLAQSADKTLGGEKSDRINLLLLGMGGEGHDGPNLTDTIILSSLQPSTGKVALLSIPRDLVIPLGNYGSKKINSANALEEKNNPGNGGNFTTQVLSEALGIEINYYVKVDFVGFIKLINDLGGIDVYVENNLDDYKYPILGQEEVWPLENRYEYLHLEKGWQHLDGELALKYARSRHAEGIEGSDFARSLRQQKILTAFKKKIFSFGTLLNPVKINSLLNALDEHLTTNLEIWEILRLAQLVRQADLDHIINYVLDDSPNNFLYASTGEDGAYILKPRSGNFSQIRAFEQNIFNKKLDFNKAKTAALTKPSLEVQNGTTINGLAQKIAQKLKTKNYQITKIGNAERQNYEKTVIYDLSQGKFSETITLLKEELGANIAPILPAWLVEVDSTWADLNNTPTHQNSTDILIIVGKETNF